MSEASELKMEMARMMSRLYGVETTAEQGHALARTTEKKVDAMVADIADMVKELRLFTREVKQLATLTESRSHAFFVEEKINRECRPLALVRDHAANLLNVVGDAASWNIVKSGAVPILEETTGAYWLASAALALIAWIDGDRNAADRHVRAALRSNDSRASLYFCLLSRRFGKNAAARRWLERYFAAQNPDAMDRDAAQVFAAAAAGELGAECRFPPVRAAGDWIAWEKARIETGTASLQRWREHIQSLALANGANIYPLLREYSPDWEKITDALVWAAIQGGLRDYFRELVAKPETVSAPPAPTDASLSADRMLNALVAEYRDDEKPLRRDYRLSRLLVEENGDLEQAEARLAQEWPAEPPSRGFSIMLADMMEGRSPTSSAAARLANRLALPFCLAAYDELARSERFAPLQTIAIRINGWTGMTADGKNVSELQAAYSRHADQEAGRENADAAEKPLWQEENVLYPGIGVILLCLFTMHTIVIPLIAMGGMGYYLFLKLQQLEEKRKTRREAQEEKRNKNLSLLSACLAEAAAFRRQTATRKREIDEAREQLGQIAPDVDNAPTPDIDLAGTAAAAKAAPDWDLLPPAPDGERAHELS